MRFPCLGGGGVDTIVRSRCEKQSDVQLLEFERDRKLEYRERAEKEKNLRFDLILFTESIFHEIRWSAPKKIKI